MKRVVLIGVACFGLVSGIKSASAQSFAIDWEAVSGGGRSVAGDFVLDSTVGQASVSAALTGGEFSLTGGFWSIVADPTIAGPRLAIQSQAASVQISWPESAQGFVLQQSQSVTGPWSQAALSMVTNGSGISVTAPIAVGHRYYRLRKL